MFTFGNPLQVLYKAHFLVKKKNYVSTTQEFIKKNKTSIYSKECYTPPFKLKIKSEQCIIT